MDRPDTMNRRSMAASSRWFLGACPIIAVLLCGCGPEPVTRTDLRRELSVTVSKAPPQGADPDKDAFHIEACISETAHTSTEARSEFYKTLSSSTFCFPRIMGFAGGDMRALIARPLWEVGNVFVETPTGEIAFGKPSVGMMSCANITSFDAVTQEGTLNLECARADLDYSFHFSEEGIAFRLDEKVILKEWEEHTGPPKIEQADD